MNFGNGANVNFMQGGGFPFGNIPFFNNPEQTFGTETGTQNGNSNYTIRINNNFGNFCGKEIIDILRPELCYEFCSRYYKEYEYEHAVQPI